MKADGANMENGLKLRPWEMDVTIPFNTTSQDVRSNSWVNFHGAAFPFGEMIEMPSAEQAFQQAMAGQVPDIHSIPFSNPNGFVSGQIHEHLEQWAAVLQHSSESALVMQ